MPAMSCKLDDVERECSMTVAAPPVRGSLITSPICTRSTPTTTPERTSTGRGAIEDIAARVPVTSAAQLRPQHWSPAASRDCVLVACSRLGVRHHVVWHHPGSGLSAAKPHAVMSRLQALTAPQAIYDPPSCLILGPVLRFRTGRELSLVGVAIPRQVTLNAAPAAPRPCVPILRRLQVSRLEQAA